jgi:hypothetical protein
MHFAIFTELKGGEQITEAFYLGKQAKGVVEQALNH